MSYDLMVFDVTTAPKDRAEFLSWYKKQAEWSESHGYNDPSVSTSPLKAWFSEMIKSYPPMNGPLAVNIEELDEEQETTVTDYSVGRSVIYGAFAWSQADAAYKRVFDLAGKHGVGFFDVSSGESAVWVPTGKGDLEKAHASSVDSGSSPAPSRPSSFNPITGALVSGGLLAGVVVMIALWGITINTGIAAVCGVVGICVSAYLWWSERVAEKPTKK